MPESIVVVGGGLSGASVVAALRDRGYKGTLTLVSSEAQLPYDRPPLSKDLLLGKQTVEGLQLHDAAWYEDREIMLELGNPAVALDPDAGDVTLADGKVVTADVIVLAIGGTARRLPIPGGDLHGLHVLRDIPDALALQPELVAGKHVAVVGGGLIGAETAASARALGCEVTIVDPITPPLQRIVGPVVAEWLHEQHADHGVQTVHAGVESIEYLKGSQTYVLHLLEVPGGDQLVSFADAIGGDTDGVDDRIEADVVVVGIGITPNTELAKAAGLAVDNGILVDRHQRTSHPRVFAVGDAVRYTGPDGPLPRVEHWDAAQRSGDAAAAAILDQPEPDDSASWFWSDRYDVHLEGVGHYDPDALSMMRGSPDEGSFSVIWIKDHKVLGAATVNRTNDARAVRRLVDRGIEVDPVLLTDPATDLRKLLRA